MSLTNLIAPAVGVSSKLLTHPHSAAGAPLQIPAVHRPMFQDPPKWTDKTRRQASKVEVAERRRRRKRACLDHESDRQGWCDASAHKLCGTGWSLGVLHPSSGEGRSWSPPIPLQIMGSPVICTAGVIVNVFIIYRLYSLLSMLDFHISICWLKGYLRSRRAHQFRRDHKRKSIQSNTFKNQV